MYIKKVLLGLAALVLIAVCVVLVVFSSKANTKIPLTVSIPENTKIDGIQIVLKFEGTVPYDLKFTPKTIEGMNMIYSKFEKFNGYTTFALAFITTNPTVPYPGKVTDLGEISYTKPLFGSMLMSYDKSLCKISESKTHKNILVLPQDQKIEF